MQTIAAVVLGLLLGAFLFLLGFFFYFLLKSIRSLVATVEALNKTIALVADPEAIGAIIRNLQKLSDLSPQMVGGLKAVAQTVGIFNQFMFRSGNGAAAASDVPPMAPPKPFIREPERKEKEATIDSGVYTSDESDMARIEGEEEARRQGIETNEEMVPEPAPDQINMG